MWQRRERVPTYSALERPFPRMHAHVHIELRFLSKYRVADFTDMSLDVAVSFHVT